MRIQAVGLLLAGLLAGFAPLTPLHGVTKIPVAAEAATSGFKVIVLDDTSLKQFSVPPDFSDVNEIWAIGPGGNGGPGNDFRFAQGSGGSGGAGGAAARRLNARLAAGTLVSVRIPGGGSELDTFLSDSSGKKIVSTDFGRNGRSGNGRRDYPPAPQGGSAKASIGDLTFDGGDGGSGKNGAGGAGGGAGSPLGNGTAGGGNHLGGGANVRAAGGGANVRAAGGGAAGGPRSTPGANNTTVKTGGRGGVGPLGTGDGTNPATGDDAGFSAIPGTGAGGQGGYNHGNQPDPDTASGGGDGATYYLWVRTSDGAQFGPGGGAARAPGTRTRRPARFAGGPGGMGAKFGGGGGGGGGRRPGGKIGGAGSGGQGGIIILYQPASGAGPKT